MSEAAVTGTRVLEGVEPIGFGRSACLCLVGAAHSAARYLGHQVTSDYLMGVSGGAFKLFWHPDGSAANCALPVYGGEPARRIFWALGREFASVHLWDETVRGAMAEGARRLIVESIDSGKPVVAYGVVGPPEACLLTGYERGGEVLLGWSYFQESHDAPFRAESWSSDLHGLLLFRERRQAPDERAVLASTLDLALRLAREPAFVGAPAGPNQTRLHLSGLAAYDALADWFLTDGRWTEDQEILLGSLMLCLDDGLRLLSCARHAAARFCLEEAAAAPAGSAAPLLSAAEAYERESEVLQAAIEEMPWHFSPEEERLRMVDRSLRARLVDSVREARALEERAVGNLDRARAACG